MEQGIGNNSLVLRRRHVIDCFFANDAALPGPVLSHLNSEGLSQTEQEPARFRPQSLRSDQLLGLDEAVPPQEVKVVFQLGEGASGYVKEPQVISQGAPAVPLSDVRGHRNGRSCGLVPQPPVLKGQQPRDGEHRARQVVRFLPSDQPPEPLFLVPCLLLHHYSAFNASTPPVMSSSSLVI